MIEPGHTRFFKRLRFDRVDPFKLILTMLILSGFFIFETHAQDIPADTEPPPLKVISKEEREQLHLETKLKERTKLGLDLMDKRLRNAEELFNDKQYAEMFKELGRFHALVDNGFAFLKRNDNGKGKVLENYKRLEIGLRAFLPRLELIRRDVPSSFEYYVRTLIKNVRDTRAKAVDPFYSDTVLPRKNNDN